MKERKQQLFSQVLLIRPVKLCSFQFGLLSGNIFHSFYSRLTSRKTSLSKCWCRYKKSLFWPFVLIRTKTRKRKAWTLSFIEEAWICRTGVIFQRFSVKRRQARSGRESESRARGGVKNTTTKTHLYPYAHQDRKTTKNILRIVNS